MKYRLPILFIFLLATPMILLMWLGQRSLAQDRIVAEHQAQALAESRLREAQTLVHSFINELEQSSASALSFLQIENTVSTNDIRAIRDAINADPFLEQLFVADAQRNLMFPQDKSGYSNSERKFYQALQPLLNDENTFRIKAPKEQAIDQSGRSSSESRRRDKFPSLSRASRIKEAISNVKQNQNNEQMRWMTWDTGTETDIYLWHRAKGEVLIGQQLSSAYWLSQLIARLPSGDDGENLSGALIRLVDKRQRIIYQWGGFNLNHDTAAQPFAKEWLTYPLDGWRLEYYTPKASSGLSNTWLFLLAFTGLALLVGFGGWSMWREYRRDMRDAESRVSFVNQVSHELKTPLTNICMYADMLEAEATQSDNPDHGRVKKFAGIVTSESQRLGRLINNVLNFSRAQQQKIEVHKKVALVDEIILGTVEHFSAAFESKTISVATKLNNKQPVLLDSELLEQVLNNLLSNVEKYAADGGMVTISSTLEGNLTSIEVHDAGNGIPASLREKLFEPFERGSDSITEGATGTGIGLSIARDLCRLHGGNLELVDTQQGACFKASLRTEQPS